MASGGHGGSHQLFLQRRLWLVVAFCSLAHGKTSTPAGQRPSVPRRDPSLPALPVRAVSLGGWLVIEGWILPSLFDGIVNKDLMDGSSLQFRSQARNANLTAVMGGGAAVVAEPDNSKLNASYSTFKVWRIDETTFNFRVFNQQFIGVGSSGAVLAIAASPGTAETFQIVRNSGDKNRVRIRAPNGRFLQVKRDFSVTADYDGESTSWWGDDDPSVFAMTNVGDMHGEYQICNGYGTTKAAPVLRNHWNTFIVEEDFKFIASNGLNAVRIPVGWWIASDPNPPAPFVGGSLHALDRAFKWAEKYKLWVIIDLHAAPGSQNGYEHSASRDGSQEWGSTDASIAQTVQVIDFLASRYATSPSLLAMGLMNEPMAPGVTLDSLVRYYRAGYAAVRKHAPKAYVVMSTRLAADSGELLRFTGGLPGAVIDVHYYVFNSTFTNMTAQQNIDFIKTNYATDLRGLTRRRQNAPLSFVGEWVAVWNVPNATKAEYQRLAQLQCHTRLSEENQVHTYMHVRIKFHAYSDIKVNTETVSRKKKKDCQRFTLNPGNEGSKHHRQSTGGCVRLAPATSSQDFKVASSFFNQSNVVAQNLQLQALPNFSNGVHSEISPELQQVVQPPCSTLSSHGTGHHQQTARRRNAQPGEETDGGALSHGQARAQMKSPMAPLVP